MDDDEKAYYRTTGGLCPDQHERLDLRAVGVQGQVLQVNRVVFYSRIDANQDTAMQRIERLSYDHILIAIIPWRIM